MQYSTLLLGLATLLSLILGARSIAEIGLALALFTLYLLWSQGKKQSRGARIAGAALILLNLAGMLFNLYPQSFAGVTYDTYMHLLAGFITTMLLAEYLQRPLHIPAIAIFLLGVGVELAEYVDAFLIVGQACQGFCPYLQDTVKDFVNNSLGILLYVISRE